MYVDGDHGSYMTMNGRRVLVYRRGDDIFYWNRSFGTGGEYLPEFKRRVMHYVEHRDIERVIVLIPADLSVALSMELEDLPQHLRDTVSIVRTVQQFYDASGCTSLDGFGSYTAQHFRNAIEYVSLGGSSFLQHAQEAGIFIDSEDSNVALERRRLTSPIEDAQTQQFFETISNPIRADFTRMPTVASSRRAYRVTAHPSQHRQRRRRGEPYLVPANFSISIPQLIVLPPNPSRQDRISDTMDPNYMPQTGPNRWNRVSNERKRQIQDEPPKPMTAEDLTCTLCADNAKNMMCVPCNHICMCETCSLSLEKQECPICREPITDIRRFFF